MAVKFSEGREVRVSMWGMKRIVGCWAVSFGAEEGVALFEGDSEGMASVVSDGLLVDESPAVLIGAVGGEVGVGPSCALAALLRVMPAPPLVLE